MASPEYAIVGRVRKAHGIKGEVLVEPYTDAPDAVFAPGRRLFGGTASGEMPPDAPELEVTAVRPFKGGCLVFFDLITDRTQAEQWRERFLFLPVSELEPLAEDEIYRHELIGMTVRRVTGEPVGEVVGLHELPQGLMLDVKTPGGGILLQYTPSTVTRVDRESRVVLVDPPAGLLD